MGVNTGTQEDKGQEPPFHPVPHAPSDTVDVHSAGHQGVLLAAPPADTTALPQTAVLDRVVETLAGRTTAIYNRYAVCMHPCGIASWRWHRVGLCAFVLVVCEQVWQANRWCVL